MKTVLNGTFSIMGNSYRFDVRIETAVVLLCWSVATLDLYGSYN